MRTTLLAALTCGLMLAALGCATKPPPRLPQRVEFSKDVPSLMREYPDLTQYPSPYCVGYGAPDAAALVAAWGEPQHKQLSWRLLWSPDDFPSIPFISWMFQFYKVWTWEFENKEVIAWINHPLMYGYSPWVVEVRVDEKK